jgi:hypothetical protein
VDMGKFPLPEREREHIRDRIVPPVFPVEGADGPVAGEKTLSSASGNPRLSSNTLSLVFIRPAASLCFL